MIFPRASTASAVTSTTPRWPRAGGVAAPHGEHASALPLCSRHKSSRILKVVSWSALRRILVRESIRPQAFDQPTIARVAIGRVAGETFGVDQAVGFGKPVAADHHKAGDGSGRRSATNGADIGLVRVSCSAGFGPRRKVAGVDCDRVPDGVGRHAPPTKSFGANSLSAPQEPA